MTLVFLDDFRETGELKFHNTCHFPRSNCNRECSPKRIATDSYCHIYIANSYSKCVHIIDKNGNFLNTFAVKTLEILRKLWWFSIPLRGKVQRKSKKINFLNLRYILLKKSYNTKLSYIKIIHTLIWHIFYKIFFTINHIDHDEVFITDQKHYKLYIMQLIHNEHRS